jgi:endonuclease/exonuclease/phosphatase family metal-dependent hydrolase
MKILFLLFTIPLFAQDVSLMTYNILNYPGNDTTTRNPYFRTTISSSNPDILIIQEVLSQSGVRRDEHQSVRHQVLQ